MVETVVSAFRPSEVRIYRPYADEVPWDLLAEAGVDDAAAHEVLDLNFLRVAKHEGRVTGAYGIRPLEATRYELVTLIVAAGYRRRGLGRWLLGHAIGLAETKGGREIVTALPRDQAARRFLTSLGFEPGPRGLQLILTPE